MTFLYFIILLCYVVITHEFGHFIFAKAFGLKVEEFSVGMGPKIVSKKIGETEYSLRCLPLGGFNRFAKKEDPRSLEQTPVLKRIVVILGGPLFNFIFGFIAMFAYTLILGYGADAFDLALSTYGETFVMTIQALVGLFTGKTSLNDLSSIVGIYSFTGEAVSQYGASVILNLAASLSISLGLTNLLPLTILDGGQIVYAIYEGIFKKKINEKVWNVAEYASLILLFVLFAITVGKDTMNLLK